MAISGDGRSNIVHENTLHQAEEFRGEASSKFVEGGVFREFDCVMTNPPYGTKAKVLEEEAVHFDLGHSWTLIGDGSWKKGKAKDSDPYMLFVERCLELLKDGGRLAIILPETAFHAPSRRHLRHYIASAGRVIAVIDLPHNAFRPHCNAKTCLLVFEKGAQARPTDTVIMAEAVQMGHDHGGKEMYKPDTGEIWDDLLCILNELDAPNAAENEFVFSVPWASIEQAGHLIPRYYVVHRRTPLPQGRKWIALGELIDNGLVHSWDGHGSPTSAEKGAGNIPYIRVKDVVNWELYRNPTSGVTEDTWHRFTDRKPSIDAGDIIFVRRGSYRVGTVAMASHRDKKIVMTRELLTLRVNPQNSMGLTPYYLLALLSSHDVQAQMRPLIFYDTTLPTVGERWRELRLPIHTNQSDIEDVSDAVRLAVMSKWEAQEKIDLLRQSIGGIVT